MVPRPFLIHTGLWFAVLALVLTGLRDEWVAFALIGVAVALVFGWYKQIRWVSCTCVPTGSNEQQPGDYTPILPPVLGGPLPILPATADGGAQDGPGPVGTDDGDPDRVGPLSGADSASGGGTASSPVTVTMVSGAPTFTFAHPASAPVAVRAFTDDAVDLVEDAIDRGHGLVDTVLDRGHDLVDDAIDLGTDLVENAMDRLWLEVREARRAAADLIEPD